MKDEQIIHCGPYGTNMSESSCAMRARRARRDGDELSLSACRSCHDGALRSGLPVSMGPSRSKTGRERDGRYEVECHTCGKKVWLNQAELNRKQGCGPCYRASLRARAAMQPLRGAMP